jgi:hypothetical protein
MPDNRQSRLSGYREKLVAPAPEPAPAAPTPDDRTC